MVTMSDEEQETPEVELRVTESQYLTLAQRYKELVAGGGGGGGGGGDIPFEIDGHLTEIETGKIDTGYMNSSFEKYIKALHESNDPEAVEKLLAELHRSFASLSQDEQKVAGRFLHDVQRGEVKIDSDRPFREYITQYQEQAKIDEIDAIVEILGVDKTKLIELMQTNVTEANLNAYDRFNRLKTTVDKDKAKAYFEKQAGVTLPPCRVNMKADHMLKDFILNGVFD